MLNINANLWKFYYKNEKTRCNQIKFMIKLYYKQEKLLWKKYNNYHNENHSII